MGKETGFEQLIEEAKSILDEGDCEAALDLLSRAEELDGGSHEVLYFSGIAHARKRNYRQAILYLNRLLDSDADYLYKLHAGMILGYVYTLQEKYEEALPYFKRIIEDGFENAQAFAAVGYIENQRGNFKDAVMNLYRAIDIDPENANAHNSLGYIYAESNLNLSEALKECKKAVQLDRNNPAYLDSLGWVYYKLGELSQAKSLLKKAIRLAPDNREIKAHYTHLRKDIEG
jgi:tetratricopeptide (TPR) repeat protein